jgi:hydrogenase maturation protein HypF
LRVTSGGFDRVAHLRPFRLPGGERAVREPRRVALGLLHEMFGEKAFYLARLPALAAFSDAERQILRQMLERGVNTPWTSSIGRLFDAVASLLDLRQVSEFEGQAAMNVEFAAGDLRADDAYTLDLAEGVLDWIPMMRELLRDLDEHAGTEMIAAKFHHTLVEGIISVARAVNEERVVLTGGCFQNKRLTERAVHRLREEGFKPYWHQRVPPNDGGIALGQVVAAARVLAREK